MRNWRDVNLSLGVLICLIVFPFSQNYAQNTNYILENSIQSLYLDSLYSSNNSLHTAIKPLHFPVSKNFYEDLTIFENKSKTLIKFANDDLLKYNSRYWKFSANPILSAYATSKDDEFTQTFHFGTSLGVSFLHKFYVDANYYYSIDKLNENDAAWADSTELVPFAAEYDSRSGNVYNSHRINGAITYIPFDYLSIQAGIGKHFWGDGYRSLFLSDVSATYPYLKFTVDVWKIKYEVLYQNLKDIFQTECRIEDKRSTSHILSINFTKKINLYLFETVIYSTKDSIGDRGPEFNYFNPFIVFRPVEFSLGSPDNVLLGAGTRINLFKDFHFYGQFLIDEFQISKIKERNGYWGNKFGLQTGIRWFKPFNVKGLSLLGEFNMVRPFTYSHQDPFIAYGHLGKPLAHPLGSNFREVVMLANYRKKRFGAVYKLIFDNYGTDKDTASVGQNIYRSYDERVGDEEHKIAQGLEHKSLRNIFEVNYLLNPKMNISCFFKVKHEIVKSDLLNDNQLSFSFGIRTNLWNDYWFEE